MWSPELYSVILFLFSFIAQFSTYIAQLVSIVCLDYKVHSAPDSLSRLVGSSSRERVCVCVCVWAAVQRSVWSVSVCVTMYWWEHELLIVSVCVTVCIGESK